MITIPASSYHHQYNYAVVIIHYSEWIHWNRTTTYTNSWCDTSKVARTYSCVASTTSINNAAANHKLITR